MLVKLRPLIGMDQHSVLRLPAPHRHQQRLQDKVRGLSALHGPADHPAGVEIDNDGQIGEALQCPDICDVGHPDPVRRFNVELSVECVVNDHGWPAAVSAGPPFVTDKGFDARKFAQACDAVRAASLTLIQEIVVKLAIAVDLATIRPRLPHQLGLAGIFAGALAERVLQPSIEAAGMDAQAATHRSH